MKIRILSLVLLLIPCWVIAWRFGVDYRVLYDTAQWTRGDLTHVYSQNGSIGRYFYGPFSLVLVYPLAYLKYDVGKALWITLQTVSYFYFWKFLHRLFPKLSLNPLAWFLVWAFAINPIHNNFQSGNIQLMLMTVLLWAELESQSSQVLRQRWAGMLVVFATAIKVFPAFIVLYYWINRGKEIKKGILAGIGVSLLVPLLVFGWQDSRMLHVSFLRNLSTYSNENSLIKIPDILCLPSLLARIFSSLDLSSTAADWAIKLSALSLSGFFFVYCWRNRNLGRYTWAFALLLMMFLNPSSRVHYFMFAIPAFVAVLELQGVTPFILAPFILVALTTEGVVGKQLNNVLEYANVPTIGILFLVILLAFQILTAIKRAKPINHTALT